jgi:hypothetical protein
MFTNYMDYTNGNCLNMFTAGQVARMTTAITSGVSGRNNLWSSTNLAATGTSDPYTYPADCPAVPEMLPYGVKTICVGDSIKFTDISYGGKSDSRLWNFGGGSASSVTDSIVKVAFSTPGTYQVQLTKNYGLNSKNVTYPQKVKVIGNTPHPGFIVPFNDGFDDSTNTMTDWTFIQNGMNDWQWDPSTGMLNTGCMTVNNFAKPAPVVTELISPAYNLSTVYNPTLFFSVSFAGRTTGNYDKLQVFISNNCASTWSQIYSNTASSSLKTVPDDSSPFLPAQGSNEWKVVKQNLNPSLAQGTVRFKFVFTSGGGNNIFLDDINLEGMNTVGLSSSGVLPRLSVFPVPSEDRLTVLLPVSGGASTLQMFDLVGREVKNFEIGSQADDKLEISTGGLTDGMYMLRVNCDGRIFNGSFVKQSAGR